MANISSGVYASNSITYNGPSPISVTLQWHASDGNSRYPGFNSYYSRSLTLNPGASFTLSVSGIPNGYTVNAYGDQFIC
jgi:hypothetical protein